MAHFAEIDSNNIVLRVIVVADEHEQNGSEWCNNWLGGRWVQTSYNTSGGVHSQGNTPLRKNYAGIGYTYDATRDAFIPPEPDNATGFNEDTCQWIVPQIET